MTTLDTLERLAKEATPGPWDVKDGNVFGDINNPKHDGDSPLIGEIWKHPAKAFRANGKYIAALDPDTVLRLVAVCRAAQEVTKQCSFTSFGGEAQDAFMEMEGALAALESEGK
jgi:hypothetical protein